MSTESPFSISRKNTAGDIITVRGDTAGDLASHFNSLYGGDALSGFLDALASDVLLTAAATQATLTAVSTPPAVPVATPVAAVAEAAAPAPAPAAGAPRGFGEACEVCGSPKTKIVMPKPGQSWTPFAGCQTYDEAHKAARGK